MGRTILAVDDEPEVLDILEERLKAHGYEVIKATNGLEAATKINEIIPALVILDVDMPVADGFKVLEVLRNFSPTASVPIIMLTGKGESRNILKALEMKATDYLVKPFKAEELLEMIQRYI